eukprot:CAMPEP_0171057010 /NCGR_PEP_ID=MMETSP0766_2-20121228/1512_1 /TAXON_ID=439317 /ORGANISM="Gambierdiscus australes, Strain CAWD 149" /LENGTH=111 /DNA_ID=CAMNT_0011512051 /DNA_START=261 /DNA_END=592 /DNA_ORIENTATION=+
MQGTSSSHGMAAAPTQQQICDCSLMHTVGVTQRMAQQPHIRGSVPDLQQNSSFKTKTGATGHATKAAVVEKEAAVGAATCPNDSDCAVVESIAVSTHRSLSGSAGGFSSEW